MGDTPTNVPTTEVPKGYENPMLLYMTLDTSLKAEKGREFSRAYLDFLKKDNPKLYAELCAADEAGKGKEGGVYTKEQLAQVAEELDKYSADKFKEEMKSNGLQNVDQARFKFETGKTTITLPTAAEPLTLVQRFDSQEQGGQNWLLGDVPYHTSSEEVFEDVKQIQELISMWQKGELVATTSNPVEIAGSFTKVISFDGRDIGAAWNNTVGADNPQQLADYLNKIYGRIQNGPGPSEVSPQEVAVAASSSPTGEAVSAAPSPTVSTAAGDTVATPAVEAVADKEPQSEADFLANLHKAGNEDKYSTETTDADGTRHVTLKLPTRGDVRWSRIQDFAGKDDVALIGLGNTDEAISKYVLSSGDKEYTWGKDEAGTDTWVSEGKRLRILDGTTYDIKKKQEDAPQASNAPAAVPTVAAVVAAAPEAPKKVPTEAEREAETEKAKALLTKYTDLAGKELAISQSEDQARAEIARLRQKSDKAIFAGPREDYASAAKALEDSMTAKKSQREAVAKDLEQVQTEIAQLDSSKFTAGSGPLELALSKVQANVPALVASLRGEKIDLPEAPDAPAHSVAEEAPAAPVVPPTPIADDGAIDMRRVG